jgi:hypothetical protein
MLLVIYTDAITDCVPGNPPPDNAGGFRRPLVWR